MVDDLRFYLPPSATQEPDCRAAPDVMVHLIECDLRNRIASETPARIAGFIIIEDPAMPIGTIEFRNQLTRETVGRIFNIKA